MKAACMINGLPREPAIYYHLGFLAFTLDGVDMIMPTKKPRGGSLTDEQNGNLWFNRDKVY
jgi:hypothetical protein